MSPWQHRTDANFPYQRWQPFPVEVANVHGEKSIGPARDFWWGYEQHNPESPPPGLQGSAPCVNEPRHHRNGLHL